MIKVDVKLLNENAKMPKKAHENDAGFDLYMDRDGKIPAHSTRNVIPLGIAMDIPVGWMFMISLRSGKGKKTDIRVSPGVGIIDTDYTGEINLIVDNTGDKDEYYKKGDRYAQGIFLPVVKAELNQVNDLKKKGRGENGMGSTGW